MAKSVRTVLVVDDDVDVLALATMILEEEGFTVLAAADGTEALQILQAHPEIDLLFTDIVMPGDVNGFELAHQAKQLRPSLCVLYASGYIKNPSWGQKGIGHGPLLSKPWRREQLRQSILNLLAGGPGPASAPC